MEEEPKYHLEDVPKMLVELNDKLDSMSSFLEKLLEKQHEPQNLDNGYMSPKIAISHFNKDETWIRRQCSKGNIKGAFKMGKEWMIPKNAELVNQTQNQ